MCGGGQEVREPVIDLNETPQRRLAIWINRLPMTDSSGGLPVCNREAGDQQDAPGFKIVSTMGVATI
jgi:hypothetical protein